MKAKIRICSLCGNPVEPEDSYKSAKAYHKKCYNQYSNRKKLRNPNSYGNPEPKEYWNEPLPEKEGGLFDYDKYFEEQGIGGNYSDYNIVRHIPVYKINLRKRA